MALQLIHPNTVTTRTSLLREYNKHFISIIQDLSEDNHEINNEQQQLSVATTNGHHFTTRVEQAVVMEISMIRFDSSSLFKSLTQILEQYLNRLYWIEFPKNDQSITYQSVSKWISEHVQCLIENQYGDFQPLPHLLVNNFKCLVGFSSVGGAGGNNCCHPLTQSMRDWMGLKIKEFINTNSPNGNVSALHVAVAKGHVDLVYWLLYRLKCNVDGYGSPGNRTPLFMACLKRNAQIVKILLECGACKKTECLFSDDIIMVSYYSGVVRKRIMLNTEKAAASLGYHEIEEIVQSFDLERCIILKKSNLKFFKHMKQAKDLHRGQHFSDVISNNNNTPQQLY